MDRRTRRITNIITEGLSAFGQVIVVAISGLFLYVTYRGAGTIIVPILVHALWDFALFSHNVGDDDPQVDARQFLPVLSTILLVVVLITRRQQTEPETPPATN